MKINYYTVIFNFNEEKDWLNLEGSGISIEFRINNEERKRIMESPDRGTLVALSFIKFLY